MRAPTHIQFLAVVVGIYVKQSDLGDVARSDSEFVANIVVPCGCDDDGREE